MDNTPAVVKDHLNRLAYLNRLENFNPKVMSDLKRIVEQFFYVCELSYFYLDDKDVVRFRDMIFDTLSKIGLRDGSFDVSQTHAHNLRRLIINVHHNKSVIFQEYTTCNGDTTNDRIGYQDLLKQIKMVFDEYQFPRLKGQPFVDSTFDQRLVIFIVIDSMLLTLKGIIIGNNVEYDLILLIL